MNILGFTLGHDSSAALACDGRVHGILEAERYFRGKRYKLQCQRVDKAEGKWISGYQYVDLADLEVFLTQVAREWGSSFDAVAVQNQGRVEEYENLRGILEQRGFRFRHSLHVDHHLAHATLAFHTSPFDRALVFSYDGVGNDGCTVLFDAQRGRQPEVRYLERNEIRFGQSYDNLGYIAGVRPEVSGTTAGKAMGLSAYGQVREDWLPYARKYVRQYQKLPQRPVDGLNNYGKAHRINSIALDEIPELQPLVVDVDAPVAVAAGGVRGMLRRLTASSMQRELRLPGPEDRQSQDLVHTVQVAWTEQAIELLERHRHVSPNLCVVGGCALNGITNYVLQGRALFAATHLIPNPSDCGLSAGAALHLHHATEGHTCRAHTEYFSPYLGVEPFDRAALPRLKQAFPHRQIAADRVPDVLARLIFEDRIVGVIRGRYEVGPRALGNRSILCNPLNPQMKDTLNEKVKHREWYRPFAPVVTVEDAHKYFTNVDPIPYMSVICYTKPEWRTRIPSVTHVDGSARLQTIGRDQNAFLYDTLKAFERLSGVPLVLNTSFNPAGEPILNFCEVGLDMLQTTDLDVVLIDDTFFCRPGREAKLLQF